MFLGISGSNDISECHEPEETPMNNELELVSEMFLVTLLPSTLRSIKADLILHVQDLAKDMTNQDTRIMINVYLKIIDKIDEVLREAPTFNKS